MVAMPDDVSIVVRYEWRTDDADGSTCVVCGDACYLSPMHRLVLCVGDARDVRTGDVVCDACYEHGGNR